MGLAIQDAIDMEAKGLPFLTRLFLYSLVHSAADCSNLGGGISIRGYLCRGLHFYVQLGVQEFLVENGVPLNPTSMPHEWLCGSLGWVQTSHPYCLDEVTLLQATEAREGLS